MEGTVNHARFGLSGKQTANPIQRSIFVTTLGTFLFVVAFFMGSCGSQTGSGQHATILMRDGSTLSGTVTSSSGSEITLTADDTTKHTIPMAQVKSIEYDDAPATGNSA